MAPHHLRTSSSTKDLISKSKSSIFGFSRNRDSKQSFRDSTLLTELTPLDEPIYVPHGMVDLNGKTARPMVRSYSTGHAHSSSMSSYSMTQAAPGTLGQGATVVRTPQDATLTSMAQPDSILPGGPQPPHRQSSLRAPGQRRPSAPPAPSHYHMQSLSGAPQHSGSAPRYSPASAPLSTPMESTLESSLDSLELLDNSRPPSTCQLGRQRSLANKPSYSSLASQGSVGRSRAGSITASVSPGVVTAGVPRSPPRVSPIMQSSPVLQQAPVIDVDAAYFQRRMAARGSMSTLTPSSHSSMCGTVPSLHSSTPSMSSTASAVIMTPLGPGPAGLGSAPSSSSHGSEYYEPPQSGRNSGHESPPPARTSPTLGGRSHARSSPGIRPKHLPSPSMSSLAAVAAPAPAAPKRDAPFAPVLVAHTCRPATGPLSSVLVTLRFGYSLDAEPNTHEVTVTYDTLRPAGGRLVAFLDSALRPSSLDSTTSSTNTSGEGPEMTDGSSAEDSDFEFDADARLQPMLEDEEYLAASATSDTPASLPKDDSMHAPPPSTRRPRLPPSVFHEGVFASSAGGLPPLSELPAALAQARAHAAGPTSCPPPTATAPLSLAVRARSNTCPGPARSTITEVTVLLLRDAGAWHTIASRLCSGTWPELAGKRRRIEEECRWAGMEPLLAELRLMPAPANRGGFL